MSDRLDAAELDVAGVAPALLDALVAISSDLDLPTVLRRIVESACSLTGAAYGVVALLGPDGTMTDFVLHGVTDDEIAAVGSLPTGVGLLGHVLRQPGPVRLAHLGEHPDAVGLPEGHPPMESYLGVPVHVGDAVLGNLYLAEKADGVPFSASDEVMVGFLADAAGRMIANARAYAGSERRRRWLETSALVSETLMAAESFGDSLAAICERLRDVLDASAVVLLGAAELQGDMPVQAYAGARSAREALADELSGELTAIELRGAVVERPLSTGTAVLVPLRALLAGRGLLVVALRPDRGGLDAEEHDLLTSFGDHLALALDRDQALSERQALTLVADRERIARDLHDVVIQRIFATGLQLQGMRGKVSPEVAEQLGGFVRDLDDTIRDIRTTIFDLQHRRRASLKTDIGTLVEEYVPALGFAPSLRLDGPVDSVVSRNAGEHLLATLREALSNVTRHARAGAVDVEVSAGREVVLVVTDDGVGIPAGIEESASGLRNARRRAASLGGRCAVSVAGRGPAGRGTRLEWVVPSDA